MSFIRNDKDYLEYIKDLDKKNETTYLVADFLKNDPQAEVFIYGNLTELYALADKNPPVKYLAEFHIHALGQEHQVLDTLQTSAPMYVVWIPNQIPQDRRLHSIERFIFDNYQLRRVLGEALVFEKNQ